MIYPDLGEMPLDELLKLTREAASGDWCHRCGHIHQGVGECGKDMGGGGICRCQMEGVPR